MITVESFTAGIVLQSETVLVIVAMNANGTSVVLAITSIAATIATKLAVAIVKIQKVVMFYTVYVMIKKFVRNALQGEKIAVLCAKIALQG